MLKTANPTTTNGLPGLTPSQRIEANTRRSRKFTTARVKNLSYYRQINNYVNTLPTNIDDCPERPYFEQYRKRLIGCGCNALYRRVNSGRECTFITGQVCNHRLCTICNMLRSRKLRRKWQNFLTDTEQNVPIKKKQAHFFDIDPADYEKEYDPVADRWVTPKDLYFTSGADLLKMFDLMHLTLTVPHTGGKWCGKEYYAQELLQKFNILRKADWWTENIFGGEYTVETTNNADGLHIHIHALLFVDKRLTRSRNELHHRIALRWNALTIDNNSPHEKVLTGERRDGAAKSFAYLEKLYSRQYLEDFLLDLNGRGSTMVGLKSLYHETTPLEAAKAGFAENTLFTGDNGKLYHYCRNGNPASILKGVIECLKYHFEPCALEDENGDLDIALVSKVLPNIYGQRLYGKFGGFYGVTALNVLEEPLTAQDMLAETADNATEAFDPRTGGEINASEYHYAIADARSLTFDKDKPIAYLDQSKIKKVISPQDAGSIGMAVKYLADYGYKEHDAPGEGMEHVRYLIKNN